MMYTGFRMSTRAGISFCIDDIIIPDDKVRLVDQAEGRVKEISEQFAQGLTTASERYNQVVDIWSKANDDIARAMMKRIGSEAGGPVHHGEDRGARWQDPGAAELQLGVHDGRLRRARLGRADPPAGGPCVGSWPSPTARSSRRRSPPTSAKALNGSPVLHLHPRGAQRPLGHGAEDRQLGLT